MNSSRSSNWNHGNPRRPYHRYCPGCGWGFGRSAWEEARFCTRCGATFKNSVSRRGADRDRPEIIPPSALRPVPRGGGRAPLPSRVAGFVRDQPIAANAVLVATGAGLVLAGPVLAVGGAALAAMGTTIAGTATTAGLVLAALGALGRHFPAVGAGLLVVAGGALIGAALSLLGALIAAAGAFLTGVGWATLAVCLLLVLRRACQGIYTHRARIAELVGQIRCGARASKLPAGKSALFVEEGPLTVEQVLDAVQAECRVRKPRKPSRDTR